MAYTKRVVWYAPYSLEEFLPIGQIGLTYTRVLVDVPNYQFKRTIWDNFDTLHIGVLTEGTTSELQTSISYMRGSLEVYADGSLIAAKEEVKRSARNFTVTTDDVKEKYVFASYIPSDRSKYLGDTRSSLETVFGVRAGLGYSRNLRKTLTLMRRYLSAFCTELELRPPLWYGGNSNFETGAIENLYPFLTPASIELHLVVLRDKIEEIRIKLLGEGISGIPNIITPAYTIGFFENIQEAITIIDGLLEQRSAG